jgi:Protein of unknown function (DUF3349)
MTGELSGRMVAALEDTRDTNLVTSTSPTSSIIQWLTAGYPEGVPGPDRVPLFALLKKASLSNDQVKEVVRNLAARDQNAATEPISEEQIASYIAHVTEEDASDRDIARVAANLAAGGWPLAGLGA